MTFRGIDIRETGDRLVFRAFVEDSNGALVATGTTSLYLYELQNDGTLKSYDFDDNTFKTTALTTETLALVHRQGNNATTNTGIWSENLTTLTGFTVGNIYLALVTNSNSAAADQVREWQFGSGQEDVAILGTVSDAGALVGDFDGNTDLSATNDFYDDCLILFVDGVNKGVSRRVTNYTGASRNFAFTGAANEADAPWTTVPANGDAFVIIGRIGD